MLNCDIMCIMKESKLALQNMFNDMGYEIKLQEMSIENQNKGDIVIYQTKDGLTKIDVRFEDETVWLSQ